MNKRQFKKNNSRTNNKSIMRGFEEVICMFGRGYNPTDLSKLNFSNNTVTTEEALKDVIPFEWTEEVLNGDKKVIISK